MSTRPFQFPNLRSSISLCHSEQQVSQLGKKKGSKFNQNPSCLPSFFFFHLKRPKDRGAEMVVAISPENGVYNPHCF
jgi:hypothetical protein